jgi:hypothetical protein
MDIHSFALLYKKPQRREEYKSEVNLDARVVKDFGKLINATGNGGDGEASQPGPLMRCVFDNALVVIDYEEDMKPEQRELVRSFAAKYNCEFEVLTVVGPVASHRAREAILSRLPG